MNVFYFDILQNHMSLDAVVAVQDAQTPNNLIYRTFFKRALDLLIVVAALPIVVPIFVILAIMVVLNGSNPVYLQRRIGFGGQTFTMWKLRTMKPDAQGLLERHLNKDELARAEWDKSQKLKNDPRITTFGKFLRKSSLDELPQLWNVLKGDMSLVGPRPMLPEQRPMYPGQCYYALRPGITGLWQVSERNQSSFSDRAKFDGTYYRSMSLKTDVTLLWATVGVVLRGTGY